MTGGRASSSVARVHGATAVSSLVWFGLLVVAASIYTSTGGAARDFLVQELLVNLMIVLGLQAFIGLTGILSFGHLAFVQIAAYAAAIFTIPVAQKATLLPDLPFGLADVHMGAFAGTILAVVVATVIGGLVGVAVARAGGLAATMITLAILFVVDQSVKNWSELTKGAGGLSGVPRLGGNTWLWVGALLCLVLVTAFRATRHGRFAVATREDEIAAPAIGIDLFTPRWVAWTLSIAVVSLAGALRVQAVGSTNPKQYTLDIGVLLLAMLIVGGMRTVSGAVVGTVVVTAGSEAARQYGDNNQIPRLPQLFVSAVLLLVMLVRSGGILGDADLATWLRRRWRLRSGTATSDATGATTGDATGADVSGAEVASGASDVLEATGIDVRFGELVALDGARIRVAPDEVVGLIGPNGAGKTTLFNVITGLVPEQAGTVMLGSRDLSDDPPHRIARAGLARTFQNLRLFSNLTVRENVELAALSAARYRPDRGPLDPDVLLAHAGLLDVAERSASTLDYGNQRRLELIRAAALAPSYLLLDEPTSGMSDAESLDMVQSIRGVAAMVGAGVLVIDHDLAFITTISDHIVVLAAGSVLSEGTPDFVRADPAVARAYLGTSA